MSADLALAQAVRAALEAAGDPERAVQQQAYMKSAMPYRGLASPELKALLRPLLAGYRPPGRAGWEGDVRALWDGAQFREEWYAALTVARHPRAAGWRDVAVLPRESGRRRPARPGVSCLVAHA